MKKLFLVATAALLFSGIGFAQEKEKSCCKGKATAKKECSKDMKCEGKHADCSKKCEKACEKDAKAKTKAAATTTKK